MQVPASLRARVSQIAKSRHVVGPRRDACLGRFRVVNAGEASSASSGASRRGPVLAGAVEVVHCARDRGRCSDARSARKALARRGGVQQAWMACDGLRSPS